jgi:uncharacterized protein
MNVDEALRRFSEEDDLPREAMRWALGHWEEAAPRFVSKLRAFATGRERSDAAADEIFYILHLCGEKGETRAYEPLCRMIAEDPDMEEWLGDATAETLPGILIKVFDGDVEPLRRAIETPGGDESGRAAALEALGYLVRAKGVLQDDEMRAYLRRLRRDASQRDESLFWLAWAIAAAGLGYDDLRIDVAVLRKDGYIDEHDFTLEDFDEIMASAHRDPDGLTGFREIRIFPFDDAEGTLEAWSASGEDVVEEDASFAGDDWPEAPYVNPFRGVGRNDPCPCGSGKKYKKCCLMSDRPPSPGGSGGV